MEYGHSCLSSKVHGWSGDALKARFRERCGAATVQRHRILGGALAMAEQMEGAQDTRQIRRGQDRMAMRRQGEEISCGRNRKVHPTKSRTLSGTPHELVRQDGMEKRENKRIARGTVLFSYVGNISATSSSCSASRLLRNSLGELGATAASTLSSNPRGSRMFTRSNICATSAQHLLRGC